MWKRIVSSLVGVSLILCGFVGVSKLKERLPTQEPIEVETPPKALSLDPNNTQMPYGAYNMTVEAAGESLSSPAQRS